MDFPLTFAPQNTLLMPSPSKYDRRGVSATKSEVHAAIQHLDKGLFPNAFCKILPDIAGGDEAYCNIMHADTAGTKTSLAYLYWRETGDLSVWDGIAQDALVMNLDDMGCVGCVTNIALSSTIGRNKHLVPGEVIARLIRATSDFLDRLREYGILIHQAGGETADVGDIVRTLDAGFTTFARMPRNRVIANDIRAGAAVVGLASYGQATYEDHYNGGIGSNGLTSARHDLLHKRYAEDYPESYDPHMPEEVVYTGSRQLTEELDIAGHAISIGKLLLSPTRTYLPVIKTLLEELNPAAIQGMIHCSGGAQTKVLHFLHGKRVVKDRLFETPPLFALIQQESGTDWREMYQVFNMGHRLEVYVNEGDAQAVIDVARAYEIEARVVGYVEDASQNEVLLKGPHGTFSYT